MISIENVWKSFGRGSDRFDIARDLCANFPGNTTIGLLGANGAGKSSLLKMIAGTMTPDAGRIRTTGRISWPIGFSGSFHGDLTGAQNTLFLARVYGRDTDALCAYVQDFAELGSQFDAPLRTYSAGMRARLSFAISMGIPFDVYLVDEVTAVGDARFREKSKDVFQHRMAEAGGIVVSHSMPLIAELCDHAVVLAKGQLRYFRDVEEAIDWHTHPQNEFA